MEVEEKDLVIVLVGVSESDWKWRWTCAQLRRKSLAQLKQT